ncbi:MAG TPA: hypothetical protein PKL84_11095 [Candidatus Hydrogenedentes bacterium]|nr:hypothetical protein [Candidatus Hydrogenedentota bacterium]
MALVRAVENVYRHLLATVSTSGELGTVCNLEQHTFPGMLDIPGAELAELVGELPEEARLPKDYTGGPRLIVLTKRTSLAPVEPLEVRAATLDRAPASEAALHWRSLGEGPFTAVPMTSAGRHMVRARLAAEDIAPTGIEYYVEARMADNVMLRWPATAPALCHTVLLMPE